MSLFLWFPMAFLLQFPFYSIEVDALKVNLISDAHFDPYYGTSNGFQCKSATDSPLGTRSCDAPRGLIHSLIEDLREQNSAYTFFMGDIQRHEFDPKSMLLNDSVGYVLHKLANINARGNSGGHSVLAAMGNNDFVPDYFFNITEPGPYFKEIVEIFNDTVLTPEEAKDFQKCGFYTRIISTKLRVIVLNTLLWTYRLSPQPSADELHDPCGQMSYLRAQLTEAHAHGAKAIVLSHIPPYLNVWKVIGENNFKHSEYWRDQYLVKFTSMMKEFSDTVSVHFYGHAHMFSFQALVGGVPSYLIPVVSSVFNNNPSYIVADLDETSGTLRSMTQRYLNKETNETGEWKDGLKVEDVFGDLANITSLRDAAAQLLVDDIKWNAYLALRSGGLVNKSLFPGNACDGWCRAAISCSMRFESVKEIADCTTSGVKPAPDVNNNISVFLLVFGLLTIVALASLALFCIYWYMQKEQQADITTESETPQNLEVNLQEKNKSADQCDVMTELPHQGHPDYYHDERALYDNTVASVKEKKHNDEKTF